MISLMLTNDCKLSCQYCYQKSKHNRKTMSVDYLNENFSKPKGDNYLHLFGGEPFSNKEAMLWFSKNKLFNYKITTNVIETDLCILEVFLQNKTLKHLKLSLAPIGSNVRYNNEKEVVEKVKSVIYIMKKYKNSKLELHFVFHSKDYDKMYNTYFFFSEIMKMSRFKFEITFSLDTIEDKTDDGLDVVFKQYESIYSYDVENFKQIIFKSFIPGTYRFCEALGQTTYDIDIEKNGCPRMLYEEKNILIKEKCLKCRNEYCFSCILSTERDCLYFTRLKKFLKGGGKNN